MAAADRITITESTTLVQFGDVGDLPARALNNGIAGLKDL
jgi:hypothetical protein